MSQSMALPLSALLITTLSLNVPLGSLRTRYERLSLPWFAAIHASLPLIIPLRKKLLPKAGRWVVPLNIGVAVIGQFAGSRFFSQVEEGKVEKMEDQ